MNFWLSVRLAAFMRFLYINMMSWNGNGRFFMSVCIRCWTYVELLVISCTITFIWRHCNNELNLKLSMVPLMHFACFYDDHELFLFQNYLINSCGFLIDSVCRWITVIIGINNSSLFRHARSLGSSQLCIKDTFFDMFILAYMQY